LGSRVGVPQSNIGALETGEHKTGAKHCRDSCGPGCRTALAIFRKGTETHEGYCKLH
jgi:hypothetical protein